MPKEQDVTTIEALKNILGPQRKFTDALSEKEHPTIC